MRSEIMKSSYLILKENRFIIEVLLGVVNVDNIKVSRSILYSDKEYNPAYDILLDIRDAKMDISAQELIDYVHYLSTLNFFATRKTAILTRKTNHAEYVNIFNTFKGKFPIEFGVFSKLTDCVVFLKKEKVKRVVISDYINELKTEPRHQWFKGPNAITGF